VGDARLAGLVTNVQNFVKSMNHAYRVQCRNLDVEYFDAFARFVDPHTVEATAIDKTGTETTTTLTADQFIVCTGGRPSYPDIPGAKEHCITSDDLFSLSSPPGKTLVVGAVRSQRDAPHSIPGQDRDTTRIRQATGTRHACCCLASTSDAGAHVHARSGLHCSRVCGLPQRPWLRDDGRHAQRAAPWL
jgi:hypothetical protein